MRKLIISAVIAATAMPAIASAQPGEIRRDRQDVRQEQRELRDAQRYGDRRDVREQRQDVREARQELREDWRDYRRGNREAFRGRPYVGPRGYRYRPYAVGAVLAPAYYGSRYVIADPWRYRLPRATGANRWVRYGNDVLLVNVRTGRIITVYNGFYW